MKHVLITGGAGFIGSHLAEALLARGYRVTALDDESSGNAENLSAVRERFNFSHVAGSAADKRQVRSLLGDVEQVYHLAGAAGAEMLALAPVHAIETNVYPTELLLNEVLRQQRQGRAIKVFLASSSAVYGKNPKPVWHEDDEMHFGPTARPGWSFGVSKALCERLALAYWNEHRLPVVIGRLFNVAGPRQSGRFGSVLPRFAQAALAGEALVVHGDGQQVRCFAHVCDVTRAMIELMESTDTAGSVVNVGSDQPVAILDLALKVIAAADSGSRIEFQPFAAAGRDEHDQAHSRIPDLARLRQAIAFSPQHDLDDIVSEVVESTRAQGAA